MLTGIPTWQAYAWLGIAILFGMIVAGATAVAMERIAYRPLRGAPRLVPLISAIGVSFFLQDLIRLVESLTTGQFYRVFPTFGNFDERISIATIPFRGSVIELSIQVKSVIVIVAAVMMVVGLNFLVNATKLGKGDPIHCAGSHDCQPDGHQCKPDHLDDFLDRRPPGWSSRSFVCDEIHPHRSLRGLLPGY